MSALLPVLLLLSLPAARIDGADLSLSQVDEATSGRAEALQDRIASIVESTARAILAERSPSTPILFERPPATEMEGRLVADRVVARAGDGVVRGVEVERRSAVALYRTRGELHRERLRRLEEQIDAQLLRDEAERQSTTQAALLLVEPVSEEDVRHYVAKRHAEGATTVRASEVRPRLESLRRSARRAEVLDRLRSEHQIEILLEPPEVPRIDARDTAATALGAALAPPDRTIVVFADYRSASSRRVHQAIDQVRRVRPDVRVELRDFVARGDAWAHALAVIARCAERSGQLERWRAEVLAAAAPPLSPNEPTPDEVLAYAGTSGLSAEGVRECFSDPSIDAAIRRDSADARAFGFGMPPALFAAGRPRSGAQSAETLLADLAAPSPRSD